MSLFILYVGFLAVLKGVLGTANTIQWHIYGADPEWWAMFERVTKAFYVFDLVVNIVLIIVGAIMIIGSIIHIHRHRCPECRRFVKKGQEYCGNCGKKI